ncbi:MAG: hypothetical protein DRQ55_00870 [Planctomycetota bacterium]|nr:MAG: hypothetical protein DRQ55_00870 [Planctomycetota bacterium]
MPTLLVALLVLLAPGLQAAAAPDPLQDEPGPWLEGSLSNGLSYVLVDAPLMSQQVLFTLLPWGLLDDGAGQTQLAHLAEHVLVRSVDPAMDDLMVDGIMVQGETMALTLRLETYAPPDRWRKALGWHADWLAGRALSEEALRLGLPRERAQVVTEVELSTRSSFTHKWALAAWNQVLRHGATHVEVLGAVNDVSREVLASELAARVVPGPDVFFVSVGPVPQAEVLEAMQERLGKLPAKAPRHAVSGLSPEQVREVSAREATWDLPLGHYMEWYLMPDEGPLDRVAADALSAIINHRIAQRGSLTQAGVQATAVADLITPEGRWMLLTASLPKPEDEALVRRVLGEIVGGLDALPEAGLVVGQMSSQLGEWPDFRLLRESLASQPGVEWIEAMQTLFLLYAQINMGLSHSELPGAYSGLSAEFLQAFAREHMLPARRSELLLTTGG